MLLNLRDRERDPRVCKQRIERLSRTNHISCNGRKLVIVWHQMNVSNGRLGEPQGRSVTPNAEGFTHRSPSKIDQHCATFEELVGHSGRNAIIVVIVQRFCASRLCGQVAVSLAYSWRNATMGSTFIARRAGK